ncbi:MAG: glycosyl hydrolase family 28-related protein [Pyrinomonadaceae bacterium]
MFGRNLSHGNGKKAAWVYLKAAGNVPGNWLPVTSVNPYKVDFMIPANLPNGTYQIWAHNGHGGRYGWSSPLDITIADGSVWISAELNVKQFGARGDGIADDEAAIQAALLAAQQNPGTTIYFPAGTYSVSRGFRLPANTRWRGEGKDQTIIKLSKAFIKTAQYDDRRYCLIFDSSSSKNVEIKDLTLDADGNLKGYLDTLIHLRGQSEIRFTNVKVKSEGYKFFDMHLSSLIFLKNCDFIGTGGFLGNAKQVFVDGCNFLGTNDANTLLDSWGANGLSVTNSTARDLDNSTTNGWAQGRFVYGNGVWGSNRNIYVGDNKTIDLSVRPNFNNQTSGEQFLWEGNATVYTGQPTTATATTVTFDNYPEAYADERYEAVIIKGKGFGQHRRITGNDRDKRTISVSPAWTLSPDSTSTLIVGAVAEKIVLYRNSIDGKSDYAVRETASSAIQPYGNSYDFIADSNITRQVMTAISSWATDEKNTIQPCYFNLYVNNDIGEGQIGALANVEYAQNMTDSPGISYFGNSFRRNITARFKSRWFFSRRGWSAARTTA